MKRRQLLLSAATAAPCLVIGKTGEAGVVDYESPYEEIDWDTWETVDSMSHRLSEKPHPSIIDSKASGFLTKFDRGKAFIVSI